MFAARSSRLAEPKNMIWIGLAGATAVAAVLRLVYVADQSIGYEEWYTLGVVGHSSVAGVWRAVNATESTPPLFYVLTWLWTKGFGDDGGAALRMVSVLAGTLTVPAAFFALRQFVGPRIALVAAWLCAISPELVIYSTYARSYALLVFVATVSVWAVGLLLEEQSRRRWAFWAVAAAASLWTHYFAIFVVGAEAVVLLVRLPERRREFLVAAAAAALLTAPLWPLLLSQSGAADRTAYIASSSLASRLAYTVRQFSMGANVPKAALEGAGIVLAVGATVLAVAGSYRRRSTQALLAIVAIGGGIPILLALTKIDDVYLPRNILGVWICIAALAACGLVRLRAIPLLAYSAICLITVVWTQGNWRYQGSPDWGGASRLLPAAAAADPVGVMPGIQLGVASLYTHRPGLTGPVRTQDLWVMVQPERGAHERALGPVPDPPLAQLWGDGFRAVGEIDYRGFRLIHLQAITPQTVAPAPTDDGPESAPDGLVLGPR